MKIANFAYTMRHKISLINQEKRNKLKVPTDDARLQDVCCILQAEGWRGLP